MAGHLRLLHDLLQPTQKLMSERTMCDSTHDMISLYGYCLHISKAQAQLQNQHDTLGEFLLVPRLKLMCVRTALPHPPNLADLILNHEQ